MAAEQVQKNADETSEGRHVLKRRGLIAGAAALVTGMVAKQTSQPVAANTDGLPLIIASANSESSAGTSLTWTGGTISSGAAFSVGDGGPAQPFTAMVAGVATAGKATYGVYAEASSGVGVKAVSSNIGVLGEGLGSGTTGVSGFGDTGVEGGGGSIGVNGYSISGIGVQGQCNEAGGTGIKGISAAGFPIIGAATGGTNGNAGVLGVGTAGPGVQGQSNGHGLVGTTFATDGQHAALIGSVRPGGNAIALRGSIPPGATGFAGVFDGDVIVNGALRVYGSPKNAAVKHPGDNSYRLLYCEESPESWFADYGRGTLAGDKAEITLDPDFAALVHIDDYHVFLTAHGPQHLHVAQQSATGFEVVAMAWATQAGGPKAAEGGGTFSYRVVAKRKDIAGERLAKVAPPPPMKPVTPFTVPETPEIKTPATKP